MEDQPLHIVPGASGGIGQALTERLAKQGYRVLMACRNPEKSEPILTRIRKRSGNPEISLLPLDLGSLDSIARFAAELKARGQRIDVLLNNAGVFFFDDLTETDSRRIERMIGLHVQTVTMLCRYFGAAMKARGKGYILNMSSMSAGMPFPGISVYAATKSYLKQFSKAIHNELYDYGVRVTAVCPGAVATDLYNLSGHYQRLGLRLGILMRPERLARKGLRALFAGRRCVTPGAVNHLFMPLAALVPSRLIRLIKRRAKFYRYGR